MYLTLAKLCFRQQVQYKWNLVFQVAGNFLRIYIKICIWQALLQVGGGGNTDFKTMAAYSVMGEIVFLLTNSHVAADLSDRVRTGLISVDLIRPVSLKWYFFFRQTGENIYYFIFEGLTVTIVSFLICKLSVPPVIVAAEFSICLILGMLIMFHIQYMIGLFTFWMKDGTYSRMITDALFVLFSGVEIPLWFYPEWLKTISVLFPFRFVAYEPISIWLGLSSQSRVGNILFMQLLWLIVLVIMEKLLWNKIQKSIEIQGG